MKTVFAILRVPRMWSKDLGEAAVLDGAGDKHVGCGITNQVGATRCVFNDDNHPENCVPITLEAGENYYIEAISREDEGGDNCAFTWQGPGIPNRVVIPDSCLSPVHDGECTTIAYYIDGLNEQVQLGSRLKVEFAAEPIDAGDLPCEPGGPSQYVFTHETEVDQVIAGMGLNYFPARYYDHAVALWISPDPSRQFWSGYSYTGNSSNPITATDPDGRAVVDQRYGYRGHRIQQQEIVHTSQLQSENRRILMTQTPALIGGGVVAAAGGGALLAVVEPAAVAAMSKYGPVVVKGTLKGGQVAVEITKRTMARYGPEILAITKGAETIGTPGPSSAAGELTVPMVPRVISDPGVLGGIVGNIKNVFAGLKDFFSKPDVETEQ